MKFFSLLFVSSLVLANSSVPRTVTCRVPGAESVVVRTEALLMNVDWAFHLYLKIRKGLKLPNRPPDGHNMGFSSSDLSHEKFHCKGQANNFVCEIPEGTEVQFPAQSVFGYDLISVRQVRFFQSEKNSTFTFTVEKDSLRTEAEVVFKPEQCSVESD